MIAKISQVCKLKKKSEDRLWVWQKEEFGKHQWDHELAHSVQFNPRLCLFDEGRRGRYLSRYIRTRFEVEALNQGPACFGWRLTNEPMTTSPALARFSRSLAASVSLPLARTKR